jgi:hypothetical protein
MVTVRNRYLSGTDDYGNDTYYFIEHTVGPCAVQQASSREALTYTDQVATVIIVFMPYGTKIGYLDSFVLNGVEYEVREDPEVWQSPFSGHTSPIRVQGEIVKGASP